MSCCLFVHDFRSYTYKGKTYSTNLSYEILRTRYLSHFDELRMLNRTKYVDVDPSNKMVLSSGDGILFLNKIDFFSGVDFFIKYQKYKTIVKNEVGKADFVIIRLDSFLGLIAAKECINLHKKYLVEVAGCVWDSFWNKGISGKIVAPFLFSKMKRAVKSAPFVIYVTEKFLQGRYPTKGRSIACSNVMLPDIDYKEVYKKREKYINSKREGTVLATIASVEVPYKNQETVIKVLGILKKKGKRNYKYKLIGSGDNSRLEDIAKKSNVEEEIEFVGSVNHKEISSILDEVDIYLQPSKQEGLPRSLIEAMSRGCLCIGSNVAGIPELLEPKYIFTIKNELEELTNILDNYSVEAAIDQSKRNIDKSKGYLSSILEKRRYDFIEMAKGSGNL